MEYWIRLLTTIVVNEDSSLLWGGIFSDYSVLIHGFNAWEMKFFQDIVNVKVAYFKEIGVEQLRSLKPYFKV